MQKTSNLDTGPDPELLQSLRDLDLVGQHESAAFEALTGGVSSDIWRVETGQRVFCVKRALARLKVASEWFAPLERNRFEVAWYQSANEILPGSAPQILAHDEAAMLFAMEFLDPATHRLWKSELRAGRAEPGDAAAVGERLGRIHAGSADNPRLAARFPQNDIFHAIRLEPYIEATAHRHGDLKSILFGLSRECGDIRRVMIHGDVSPKNILLGPGGPVLLDAECACIGDPAFDLAFCLNHFLLKCLWTPSATAVFLACFTAMRDAYLAQVGWEPRAELESRAARLLPALLLARVDGKSPVEYITAEAERMRVRNCARPLLFKPPTQLSQVLRAWQEEIDA